MSSPKPKPEITPEHRLANSRGGRIGGKIRAERLSPEERKAIAKKAAEARWSKTAVLK
jgi:hypothetical protein